ncbi:hypothetical protein [Parapedobacter sp. DT-150]|uniref:hypothetical protein n=1 Tax=Parapedobacter sp. DT-150 TaxID=3396162 RepID=UPI003F19F469
MQKSTEFLEIRLYSKIDLTDSNLAEYLEGKSQLTIREYSEFLTNSHLYNVFANRIIEFLLIYGDGYLKPEKCDVYEPIKETFKDNLLDRYVRWLSQPGGAFFFKKTKPFKMEGYIENVRFRPIFEEGRLIEPKASLPRYLTEIKILIDKKILTLRSSAFLFSFLREMGRCINASFGFVSSETEINKQHYLEYNGESGYVGMNANLYLTGVYWINYYGSDYVKLIGKPKLETISSLGPFFTLDEDCLFSLSRSPDTATHNLSIEIISLLGKEYFFSKLTPQRKYVLP